MCPLNFCRFPNFNVSKQSVSIFGVSGRSTSFKLLSLPSYPICLFICNVTFIQDTTYWTSCFGVLLQCYIRHRRMLHKIVILNGNALFIQSRYRASDVYTMETCKTSKLVFRSSFCKEEAFPGPQILMRFIRTLTTRGLHIQAALAVV